ncbi:MAG TPA: phosphoglycolate phosphatase [Lachnospiraceae bacterium]|nr:phosphoglycolate phosphatase [Lachnospiraceae bacterium]
MLNKEKKYKLIMFDLDGTINDSGEGIIESVQYALDHFGLKNEPVEKLRKFVGPSLVDSFTNFYHMSEEDVKKAVALYREVYESGNLFHLTVYEGMKELLKALNEKGNIKTSVVTSKPYKFAVPILEKFQIKDYFSYIIGTDVKDPSSDKSRLIDRAIEEARGGLADLEKSEAIMIGDTHFDIEGAKKSEVASIGVSYGYGTREELERAGADIVVDSVSELSELLLEKL